MNFSFESIRSSVSLCARVADVSSALGLIALAASFPVFADAQPSSGDGSESNPYVYEGTNVYEINLGQYNGSKYVSLNVWGGGFSDRGQSVVATLNVENFLVNKSYPTRTIRFENKIVGSGVLAYSNPFLDGYQKWRFSGDLSEFYGKLSFVGNPSEDCELQFSGQNMLVSAKSVSVKGAKLTLMGNAGVTFTGRVSASSISVGNNATLTIARSGIFDVGSQVLLETGGSVNFEEGATLTADLSTAVSLQNASVLSSYDAGLSQYDVLVTFENEAVTSSKKFAGVVIDSSEGNLTYQDGRFVLSKSFSWKGWGISEGDEPNLFAADCVALVVDSGSTLLAATADGYRLSTGGHGVALLESVSLAGLDVCGGQENMPTGSTETPEESWLYIDGATVHDVIGGNVLSSDFSGNTDYEGNSHIVIHSGNVHDVIGGNKVEAGIASFGGNAYVEVSGGTVQGNIYGGSVLLSSSGDCEGEVSQGAVSVTIGEDAIVEGDIYAAGGLAEGSTAHVTTKSCSVTVCQGASFSSSSVISGGYENTTLNTTVDGEQKLVAKGSFSVAQIEQFTLIEASEGVTVDTAVIRVGKPLTLSLSRSSNITFEQEGGTLITSQLVFSTPLLSSDRAIVTVESGITFTLTPNAIIDVSAWGDELLSSHSVTLISWTGSVLPEWTESLGEVKLWGVAGDYKLEMQGNNMLLVPMTIPEPTIATLGLLALAILCVHRRRQGDLSISSTRVCAECSALGESDLPIQQEGSLHLGGDGYPL